MDHAGTTGPLAAALPVANQTGTLLPYFAGNPVAGKLRGKTGTLTGAKALTGFVPADDGHTVTFAFVYNGPNARGARRRSATGSARRWPPTRTTPTWRAFSPAPSRRGAD